MTRGKLITVEGTDCSGKKTQTEKLVNRLKEENINVVRLGFPMYDTPTGKIVGGCYLGKKHISEGLFPEGASNVDPKVSSLYYGADRRYNLPKITEYLDNGVNVILDRYVGSNMGHQGGMIEDKEERLKMYKWLETLEYDLLELPRPDMTIFLYMPLEYSKKLKNNREEGADQLESDDKHLLNAERAYLELCDIYGYNKINCVKDNEVRTIEDIHEEVYSLIKKRIR